MFFNNGELESTEYEVTIDSPNGSVVFSTGDRDRAAEWVSEQRYDGLYKTEALFIIECTKKIIKQYYQKG